MKVQVLSTPESGLKFSEKVTIPRKILNLKLILKFK